MTRLRDVGQFSLRNFIWAALLGCLRLKRILSQTVNTRIVKLQALSCGSGLTVNARSSVTGRTVLGENVNFNGLTVTGGGEVRIGDNFHSGPGCLLIAHNHNYHCGTALPYDGTYIQRPISIEDNVWLGSRVIVLGGVTIGEGAVVQAGSVVVRDVPPFAVVGGHPAEIFKWRDREHYERLKSEGRFH